MQRIVSRVYMSQTLFEGPVHVSWGIGARRRELVRRFGRRVRDWTLERRMASLPGGFCCCDLPYPDERTDGVFRKRNTRMVKGVRYFMVQLGVRVRSWSACDDLSDPADLKRRRVNLSSTLSTTLTRSSPTAMG